MACNKAKRKRITHEVAENDGGRNPVKIARVPEDQLKLERVLKSASKDKTILDRIKGNLKPKERPSQHPQTKCKENTKEKVEHSEKLPEKTNIKTVPPHQQQPSHNKYTKKGKESEYFETNTDDDKVAIKIIKRKLASFSRKEPSSKYGSNNSKQSDIKKEKPKRSTGSKSKTSEPKTTAPSKIKGRCSSAGLPSSPAQSKATSDEIKERTLNKKAHHKSVKQEVRGGGSPATKVTSTHTVTIAQATPVSKPRISNTKLETLTKGTIKGPPTLRAPPIKPVVKEEEDSDSDESDWEEVEDVVTRDNESQLPSEPVTITLQGPDLMHKNRKKGQLDLEALIRRRINRADQELQLHMHKVHLLCLLSHGFHRNRTCKDDELLAHGLSVVPRKLADKEYVHWDGMHLSAIVKWFHGAFTIEHHLREYNLNLKQTLVQRFANKGAASEAELVFLMVIILRGLGAQVRLVTSLQPVSHKRPKRLKGRKSKSAEEERPRKEEQAKPITPPAPKPPQDVPDSEVMTMLKLTEGKHRSPQSTTNKASHSKVSRKESENKSGTPKTKSLKRRSCASKVNYNDDDDDDDDDIECLSPRDTKSRVKGKTSSEDSSPDFIELISSDSDFEEIPTKVRKNPSVSRSVKNRKSSSGKIVSSDTEDIEEVKAANKEKGSDYFLEVFLERAESWIPVDCIHCRVNHAGEIESNATQPMYYVLGYDNDCCIKDVTSRYASEWMSTTRKLRKDEPWWEEVLAPYAPRDRSRDQAEDTRLHSQQLKKPLPTSVTEYKNHPLYALKRHLLKFEAIYPPSAIPAGYIKGEPVYARECVHQLHTRETWLKEGRAVRVDEKPYKLVKARKKRPKKSYEVDVLAKPGEEQAECFGNWQTEQYMPPPAYEGKVPRNKYGNVEIFKPWMIPMFTVHLPIPGLNKVARKLDIDCAPAMVGWDFHGGFNHPIMDGFIVCEEHKDILLAAWDEEQEIQREKAAEKREQRALLNWKKIMKSLLIRERMKKRFDLQESKVGADANTGSDEKAQDVQMAWPVNRPDIVKKLSTADQSALFPSEEL